MGRARLLISGVLVNWTAFAVAILVSFFLSPFIVHRLGNIVYGVWVIATSSVAYMALLDLGMRGGVTYFVAKHHAIGEHNESSSAVSVALMLRGLISLIVIVASLALAVLATKIFKIPPEMSRAARWAIAITGINLALSLISGVFAGVLTALQRFDLTSGMAILQTLINAAGIVAVLTSGHGIITLAVMQLVVSSLIGAVTVVLCFQVYPELRLGRRFLDRKIVPELWRYSIYLFVIAATSQVIYYTDNLVVGAFLSAEAVTFYAIGGRFIDYLGQLGSSLAQTFMPAATSLVARREYDQLRRLLTHGTRAAILISLPIGWVLFFLGPNFISLWMGAQYAQPSGRILRILLLSTLALAGNRVAGNIIFGLGKHKRFAIWQSCEAVANFTLSIYLVRRIGIDGVAWGTVLPSLVSQLVLWPVYICKVLNLKVRNYFWQGWLRPALATAPFCVSCIWMDYHWTAKTMAHFWVHVATTIPLLVLGVILVFWSEVNYQLRTENSFVRGLYRRPAASQ